MSTQVPVDHEYAALMHESGETVCGDLNSPLKSKLRKYRVVEKQCESAITRRFRVEMRDRELIKDADVRLWATERRDLLNWDGQRWGVDDDAEPFEIEIDPVGPYEAAQCFLKRFKEIAPPGVPT